MLRYWIACLVLISEGQVTRSEEPRAGDFVVAIDDAELKVENRVVDHAYPGFVAVVQIVNGNWFWVRREKGGWIERSHIRLTDDAITYFKNVEKRNPRDPVAFFGQAVAWDLKRQYQLAIVNFDIAILIRPNPTYYCCRASSWTSQGDPDRALSDYDAALSIEPTNALIYSARAEAWAAKADLEHAFHDYDHALRLDPNLVSALVGRAHVSGNRGDYQTAIADLTEALRLEPQFPNARRDRALVYEFQGLHRKAIVDYEGALTLSPDDMISTWRLASLFAASADPTCRDGKKAILLATKACTLADWNSAPCIEALAAAFAETGNFDRAVHWQSKALEVAPNDEDRGKLLLKLQQYRDRKPYRIEQKQ